MDKICTGSFFYLEDGRYQKTEEKNIPRAVIKGTGKEIRIDYDEDGERGDIKLDSTDGLHFEGTYKCKNDIGKCHFNLYENIEGDFLMGGYSGSEGDNGVMWITLKASEIK